MVCNLCQALEDGQDVLPLVNQVLQSKGKGLRSRSTSNSNDNNNKPNDDHPHPHTHTKKVNKGKSFYGAIEALERYEKQMSKE